MKIRVCLIFSFLFSVILLVSFPLKTLAYSDFYLVEKVIKEESDFVESGVKIEYECDLSSKDALKSIIKKVRNYYSLDIIKVTEDSIKVKENKKEIDINVYRSNDKTLIDMTITNFNKEKKILNLIQDLSLLQVNTFNNPRYFQYIKGKIYNTEEGLDILNKVQKIKDIDTLDIHNGYVGTGRLESGVRVNFAVSNYDKGTYLVIGTPIIFSTY